MLLLCIEERLGSELFFRYYNNIIFNIPCYTINSPSLFMNEIAEWGWEEVSSLLS